MNTKPEACLKIIAIYVTLQTNLYSTYYVRKFY